MKEAKATLRKKLLQQRKSLSFQLWRQQSDRLCEQLQSHDWFQEATTILGYFSFQQEPDISPLFAEKIWGFPRCVEKSLFWQFWRPGDALEKGKYGILTPSIKAREVSCDQVDLILVPAVACDYRGYRLGYGGGFYDRMFSQPQWQLVRAIAIVFDFAYLPELPVDVWDQKLPGVCTESLIKIHSQF